MLTYDQLTDIITNRRFDELIGQHETDVLETKSEPYQLKDDYGKSELAKDVSALANHEGGYLIIGLRTEKDPTSLSDKIIEMRSFQRQHFDTEQYRQIISSWVYPSINNLNVVWIETDIKTHKGLGIINVPPQPEEKKPFLITKTILDSGRRDILVGYAQRRHDQVEHISIEEIHQLIRNGLQYDALVSKGFDELHAKLDTFTEGAILSESLIQQEDVNICINHRITDADLNDKLYISFAVHAEVDLKLQTLFMSHADSLGRLLGSPPELRRGGFGIWASPNGDSHIIDGNFRRSLYVEETFDRRILVVYRNGILIFAAGVRQFCHAMEDYKINPTSIVETAYNFCAFFKHVLNDSSIIPDKVILRARINQPSETQRFTLPAGRITMWPDHILPRQIDESCVNLSTIILTTEFDPAVAAVKLLEEIYIRFGLEMDDIPYVTETDGVRQVDIDEIRNLR